MPEIIIVKNEAEAGEIYGRCVADLIKAKPDAVLGLATGSSPLAAYQALAKIVKDEAIDVSGVRGFALDEYIGLPLTHPESYHATIHRTVVEPLGLDPAKVHVPGYGDGNHSDRSLYILYSICHRHHQRTYQRRQRDFGRGQHGSWCQPGTDPASCDSAEYFPGCHECGIPVLYNVI